MCFGELTAELVADCQNMSSLGLFTLPVFLLISLAS